MAKVDILNYISDSNILRSTYDTDTNELDITDVPQNLNSVITLGQGGGGAEVEELNITANGTYTAPEGHAYSPVNVNVESAFKLLNTISVDQDVRAVNIIVSDYSSYDIILIYIDAVLSASDWIYYVRNGSTPTGGTYASSSKTHHKGICGWNISNTTENKSGGVCSSNSYTTGAVINNLYAYTYDAGKTIKAGSSIKIYGGNYADM